jgi:protein-disulfide isomerase
MTLRLRSLRGGGATLSLALLAGSALAAPARPPQTPDEAAEILTTRFNAEKRSIVQIKMSEISAFRKGRPDAPVVILEFTDFRCSRCRAFYLSTFPRIESELIEKGLVLYVSLNYYLKTPDCARAALAAGAHGKYWEMKDLLMTSDRELGDQTYVGFAHELNLGPEAFMKEYNSDAIAKEADLERSQGRSLGVVVTPTFLVGWRVADGTFVGARISGPESWTFFRDLVEQMING